MTELYAVIGHPIDHSQSPFIHQEFARQTGLGLDYERLRAPLDGFEAAVRQFIGRGGKGLNVTLPFKLEACQLSGALTERARAADAVNTLTFRDGQIQGDNTDGVGLVRDIVDNLDVRIQGKRLLLLGAGGAVRGVLQPLLAQHPASLTVANRTVAKAEALVTHFAQWGEVDAAGYDDLAGQQFDIVINGTSTGLSGNDLPLPAGLLAGSELVYDMVYGKGLTPFLARGQAERAGMLSDGLGMLVEQAAESWHIWHGGRPNTRLVMNSLRERLA